MSLTPEIANEFEAFKKSIASHLQRQQDESVRRIQQLRDELTLEYQERARSNEQYLSTRQQLEALQQQWEQAKIKMGLAQAAVEKKAQWEARELELQSEISVLQSEIEILKQELVRVQEQLHEEARQSSQLTLQMVDLKLEQEKERHRLRGLPENTSFNLPDLLPDEKLDPDQELRYAQKLAFEDSVTGLPSLALGRRFLDVEHEKARQTQSTLGLAIVDIEHLDDCNEVLGREFTDQALAQFAQRLKGCLKPQDTLVRGPQDEFWIISALETRGPLGIKNQQEAIGRSLSLFLESLKKPLGSENQKVQLTFVAGAATSQGKEDVDEIITHARLALTSARTSGKHRMLHFQPEQEKPSRKREQQIPLLQQALHRSQFDLRFQPVVELSTRAVKGVESLLRWVHPLEGLIDAGDFLEAAREGGMLLDLGDWVAHQVCPISRNYRHIYWFINVSSHELIQSDFVKRFTKAIEVAQLSRPDFIVVDFRESDWGLNNSKIRANLRELRRWNVRLAVDDFCFESFSLKYLERLGVDFIKLGLPITHNLEPIFTRNLIRSAVAVADSLGAKLVAEGVENQGQLDILMESGCHWGQGHHLCSPLTFAELEEKLETRSPRG